MQVIGEKDSVGASSKKEPNATRAALSPLPFRPHPRRRALALPWHAQAQSPEKFEQVVPRAQPAAPKPRAVPVKPPEPAPTPAAPAPLPLDQQPPVVELKRKAQAKEAENGFCLQTGWPDVSRATRLDVITAGQADLWLGDKACGLTRAYRSRPKRSAGA